MRCLAGCTANSYQLDALSDFFQAQHYEQQHFHNVLHIQNSQKSKDIFFFQHGCFVAWGLPRTQEQALFSQLNHFSVGTLSKLECHSFVYQIGEETNIVTTPEGNSDIITLAREEACNILFKLAISYGLSRSVKLRSHEISIQKIVAESQLISRELATRGHISLSRKAIFKRIGEIFLVKGAINLSNEYLDMSEYFWRYPHLECHYTMVEKFLDIQKRLTVLNQRLDAVRDVVVMLNNQLEHRYSSALEIIIIALIFAEIVMSILF